jgi:hypothetical protein
MHCGCRGCWRCKTATTCGRPGSLSTCLRADSKCVTGTLAGAASMG